MTRWVLIAMLVAGCASRARVISLLASEEVTWSRRELAAQPNHSDEPPFLNGWPAHVCFAPRGNSLTPWFSPQEAQIRVFEVAEYRALFKDEEREEFDKRFADLQAALRGDVSRFPEILPAVEASPAFRTNIAAVCGDGWRAVRTVTMYVQDNCLVENGRLFYAMLGLSDDQRYWVSAYWPVRASNLPTLDHQVTREELETLSSSSAYAAYLAGMITQLEHATFAPTLDEIDEIVGGLKLVEK